jgi:hypothetical protein
MKIVKYEPEEYQFRELVSSVFDTSELDKIHERRGDLLPLEKLCFENESKTKFHDAFYKKLNSGWPPFMRSYRHFIENEVYPLFKRKIIYQNTPSFRVHLPGSKAIHKWHYDSDPDHMHPEWEINFQIAITDIYKTNAMWVESAPGLRDYGPIEMKYGEFAAFDGNRCAHGNKPNKEKTTRMSFDFRVIPYERYIEDEESASITSNKKFVVGEYYSVCDME